VDRGIGLLMHSAKWRLLLAYAWVLGIVILLFGGALVIGLNYSFDKTLENSMQSIATDIKNDELIHLKRGRIDTKEEFLLSPVFIEVYEESNGESQPILSTKNMENCHFPKGLKLGFQEVEIPFISQEDEVAVLVNRVTLHDRTYKIVIATPIEKIDDTIEMFIGWLIFAGLLLYAIALILGYNVITHILSPVRTITQTAETISKSNLSKRVPLPKREDEFYQLAKTFNTMLEGLEKSFEKINRFNVNVSHELKTPLTIIRGEVEVALMKERSAKEYQTVLHTILEETETLQSIIETMLLLSKSDTEALKKRMAPLSLDTLVHEAVEEKRHNAHEHSIELIIKALEPTTIIGESTLLKRAIVNILDNAIKYSPPNTHIEITLKNSDHPLLMIEDSGYGIPSAQIEKIFDPFYRIESTNEKRVQGQGLGLSIVQWIVTLHDANIAIESEVGQGSCFRISFKKI